MDWDILGGDTGLAMGLRREAGEGDVTVSVWLWHWGDGSFLSQEREFLKTDDSSTWAVNLEVPSTLRHDMKMPVRHTGKLRRGV